MVRFRYALTVLRCDDGSASFVGWASAGLAVGTIGTAFANGPAQEVANTYGEALEGSIVAVLG